MRQKRICIYSTDVEAITGKSPRASRTLLNTLRKSLGKASHQQITCCELGAYLSLDPEVIYKTINNLPLLVKSEG
jgi:hypothetical protein